MSRRTSNRGNRQRKEQVRKQKGRAEETETEVRGGKENQRKQEKLKVEGVQRKRRRNTEKIPENGTK